QYRNRYGVDGIMIGRAAIGYPWIFREIKHFFATGATLSPPTLTERIAACRKHLQGSVVWKGERLGILEMRRHYANYLKGLSHIKEFRMRLVTAESLAELDMIFEELQTHYTVDAVA